MSVNEDKSKDETGDDGRSAIPKIRPRIRIFPILITLCAVAFAALLVPGMWEAYMGAPWTRDGTVRVYVVTVAPEISGRVLQLPVTDNQHVHKGDLLMVIDPADYTIAVNLAQAAADQAKADADNKQIEAQRRERLSNLATSTEEKQTAAAAAASAQAVYRQAMANLDRARLNLQRTQIRSPVNGYITNLLVQVGDYVNTGQTRLSLVNSDSFWVDGYFEETNLWSIRNGDPATIKLMGTSQVIRGHVDGIARAIHVANSQPSESGLATVNPIFTWVRLAQRIPVRIHIDQVPDGVRLVAGMTASVEVDPQSEQPAKLNQ